MSSAAYTPYSSATLKATVGQPTGSSRLCLSCHDGTVALGMVNSRGAGIAMNSTTMPAGPSNLGTDLSSDHPVSFTYDAALVTANGNLHDPAALGTEVRLDRAGQLQCTSCHDPHNNQFGNFLVVDNTGSALCLTCHTVAPATSASHVASTLPLPAELAAAINPPQTGRAKKVAVKATVASAGCSSCHVPHTAASKQSLMRFSSPEKNCMPCHSGAGPGKNIGVEMNKFSRHPMKLAADTHSAQEDIINPPTRHVTCADCHNTHVSTTAPATQSQLSGALQGVAGVGAGGSRVRTVTHEYEVCFRCHADSTQRGEALVPRQSVETNTRREFSPSNVSFHPVEAAGKNSSNPSLILPLTASSTMNCTDCHNNDQGPATGGTGARGPHGSAYAPLLERQLLLTDGTAYNSANFALCYKCHSSSVVDSSLSTSWRYHKKHIEEFRAACTTCHDSHGASQPHLINFNPNYVKPYNGVISYTSTGVNHGNCTLSCHDATGKNVAHKPKSY
jgi:predicted CXXCH cytochrome family protein